jgi:hypothetical protein
MEQVKVLLLRGDENYYIGQVTELDEEPMFLFENCYKIVECAEYGSEPEMLEKRAYSLEGRHLKTSARKIDEGAEEKDWYVYEYAILQKYPKYTTQREIFLTSDAIATILDPEEAILGLYKKYLEKE